MFKQKNRLTKHKDFETTFKNGRSNYGKLLGVKVVQNNLPESRFTVVAGLKVSKKAVERNRAKRQVREAVTKNLDKLKSGYDLVILCLPVIVGQDSTTIRIEIEKIFSNLKLYK
jgi:ribonuclease P protein component